MTTLPIYSAPGIFRTFIPANLMNLFDIIKGLDSQLRGFLFRTPRYIYYKKDQRLYALLLRDINPNYGLPVKFRLLKHL